MQYGPIRYIAFAALAAALLWSAEGVAGIGKIKTLEGAVQIVGQVNVGPYSDYGALSAPVKLFMALQMILGRLEIIAPIVLLTPAFWRR